MISNLQLILRTKHFLKIELEILLCLKKFFYQHVFLNHNEDFVPMIVKTVSIHLRWFRLSFKNFTFYTRKF